MATSKGKNFQGEKAFPPQRALEKLSAPGIVKCPRCQKMKLSHRVCKYCGYYDGQEIIKVEAAEK